MKSPFTDEEMEAAAAIEADLAEVAANHFGHDKDDARRVSSQFVSRLWNCDSFFFDAASDVDELQKFINSLDEIRAILDERLSIEAHGRLYWRAAFDVHAGPGPATPAMAEYGRETGSKVSELVSNLSDYGEELRRAAKLAQKDIDGDKARQRQIKRMNIRAMRLTHVARQIWKFETGSEAPRRQLNPASRFGKFLADVLEVMGDDSNPQSAFRAWAKHVGADEIDT